MENKAIPSSSRTIALLLAQASILGFSTSILYTTANSLFLARHGAESVPLAYLATAALVPPVFALLVAMQKRLSLSTFCLLPLLVFAALLAVAPVLHEWKNPGWLGFALMVALVLLMQTNMIVLGARANQLWDVQEMKRLYPLVMAGQVAGVIIGGGMVGSLSQLLGGTPRLLYVVASGLAAGALFGVSLPSGMRHSEPSRRASISPFRITGASLLGSTHVRRLLAYRIALELGSNLVNFLFLQELGAHLNDTESITTFLGGFMAVATLLTLAFLVLVTGRILLRFGVGVGLAGNPLVVGVILGGATVFAWLGGTGTRVFYLLVLTARLMNFVLVTGLADPALKAAYQPLDKRRRETVQTVVEGVGVPVAVGLAGAILLGVSAIPGIGTGHIAFLTLSVMVLVFIFSKSAFNSYRLTLERALSGLHIPSEQISLDDKSSLDAVVSLLEASDGKRVRLALDILQQAGIASYRECLPSLLQHQDAGIRREVLLRIEAEGLVTALPAIRQLLDGEQEVSVKASALRAICLLDHSASEEMISWIHDDQPEIRMATLAGLIRSRGVDGALVARYELGRLLESDTAEDRLFLAQLVGEVGSTDFSLPLDSLLRDPDPTIRRAALIAASRLASPRLLGAVLDCMEDRQVRSEAGTAIVAFGEQLLFLVVDAMDAHSSIPKDTRLCLVRACGRLEARNVASILAGYLGHPDPDLRSELARTLTVIGYAAKPEDRPGLRRLISAEMDQAEMLHDSLPVFQRSGSNVLAAAVAEELDVACRRLCSQLGFLYGKPGLSRVPQRLYDGDAKERGLALELLELSLEREFASRVIPLLDKHKLRHTKIAAASPGAIGRGSIASCSDILAEILSNPGSWPFPWIMVCAVYEAAQMNRIDLVSQIRRIKSSADIMLERAASQALMALESNGNGGIDMVDVQRVILLKSSPIFEETPSRSLASLASLAAIVEAAEGETIIHKGEFENCLYVIARGCMRVHDEGQTIALLEAGEIIGEMALLDPAPRAASVIAVEDSMLLRLDKEAFDLAMADNPEIAHGVLKVLCRRLRAKIQRPV